MTHVAHERWLHDYDYGLLPEDFEEQDGGGLVHLQRQIQSRGWLTVEGNWGDSEGSGDTTDCNRLIGAFHGVKWHPPDGSSDYLHYRPLKGEVERERERLRKRVQKRGDGLPRALPTEAQRQQAERDRAEYEQAEAAEEQARQAARAAAEEARRAEEAYPGFGEDRIACKQALYALIGRNQITYGEFNIWLDRFNRNDPVETVPALWQRWEEVTGGTRPSRRAAIDREGALFAAYVNRGD